jgi:uncharacterized glyoxalase superfamily protein PhnB
MNTSVKAVQRIYPVVRYKNAKAAIAWLASALGFREHEIYEGESDTIAHAVLTFGGNAVMLGSVKDDAIGGIYLALDTPAEVDQAYARAKAAGARITRELCDTDYGSREFSVCDPEGRAWSFGTYRPKF